MTNLEQIDQFIQEKEGDSIVSSFESVRQEFNSLVGKEKQQTKRELKILEWFKNDKNLRKYAELKLKDDSELTLMDNLEILQLEVKLSISCAYFDEFKNLLNNLKSGGDVSWDGEKHQVVTPEILYTQSRQSEQDNSGSRQSSEAVRENSEKGLKVHEAWNYISNGGTFNSPTKGCCKWNKHRGICSTGSFNVLWLLGLPKVSDSTATDLSGDVLRKMGLEYIGKVDPKHPENGNYTPQDGDTAVWPKFKKKSGKWTQHQATYLNGHWISDKVQDNMSCYPKEPNEPSCMIYRYNGKKI